MYVDVILEFKCSLPFPDFKLVIVILHDISEATYDGAISSGECKHKPLRLGIIEIQSSVMIIQSNIIIVI